MNNFYLIDKPLEISSFDIIRKLRKKLNISKMWHTWTLDPLATWGVLIAVWNYTKLIPYFEKDYKTYEFSLNLDGTTDSFDLAEKITFLTLEEKDFFKKNINQKKIEEILKENFNGIISQIPPKYSALKINWKKACDLVRDGKEIKMKSREVEIFNIKIIKYNYPELVLEAKVSAWTYIRSIASDLWEFLGTWAYITNLRRTKIWDLDINLAINLENFDENKNLNIKELFKNKIFITLDNEVLKKINNWLKVYENFDFEIGQDLFVTNWQEITNIVEYSGEYLFAKRKIL
jgi:tRNA pseudouridine55 synthase